MNFHFVSKTNFTTEPKLLFGNGLINLNLSSIG